jgi:hypothetical protein
MKTPYVHAVSCIITFTSQGLQCYPPEAFPVIETPGSHIALACHSRLQYQHDQLAPISLMNNEERLNDK